MPGELYHVINKAHLKIQSVKKISEKFQPVGKRK